MKNLDLNKFGVQEMNAKELMVTDGGSLLSIIIETIKKGYIILIA